MLALDVLVVDEQPWRVVLGLLQIGEEMQEQLAVLFEGLQVQQPLSVV
jgi:hypothetical protein